MLDASKIEKLIRQLPEGKRKLFIDRVNAYTRGMSGFVPQDGAQLEAYLSPADLLLYGGAAAGGKSALGAGLALNEHRASLLVRRSYNDVEALCEQVLKFHGSRDGFRSKPRPQLRFGDGRVINFGAFLNPGDELSWQGREHDFMFFDEVTQLDEDRVFFVTSWLRSSVEGQRCRIVFGSNPPMGRSGRWVIRVFRPWLDPTHPNPAKYGELRWFITAPDGSDVEVESSEPVVIDGREYVPLSRTFIPAKSTDNKYISASYRARLDSIKDEVLRSALRDGNFMVTVKDDAFQLIKQEWVEQAFERHEVMTPPSELTSVSVDISAGGDDKSVFYPRYDWYFDNPRIISGKEAGEYSRVYTELLSLYRKGCVVILDAGGGYAGEVYAIIRERGVIDADSVKLYKGSHKASHKKDASGVYKFANMRSLAYWKLARALDPTQIGGAKLALPRRQEIVDDLCSLHYEVETDKDGNLVITVESKESVKKTLGRSSDDGDALAMSMIYDGVTGRDYGRRRGIVNRTARKVINTAMKRRERRNNLIRVRR